MKDPLLRDCRYLSSSSPSSLSSSSLTSSSSTPTSQRSTISTSESGQELWPVGVKLGIVRLGYSAGKLKYTLVDEQDIVLAREYTFEARLEVDPSSAGAVVFAYAYLTHQPHSSSASSSNATASTSDRQMILLQDLIWRRHYGPIPERKRVVHRNHISMDNRLDNLCLIDLGGEDRSTHVWYTMANQVHHPPPPQRSQPQAQQAAPQPAPERDINNNNNQPEVNNSQATNRDAGHHSHNHHHHSHHHHHHYHQPKSSSNDLHLTLYWAAIQQLPPEQLQQQQQQQQSSSSSSSNSSSSSSSAINTNGGIDAQAELNSASRCYDKHGNLLSDQEESISYFECHYGPCVRIERQPREFSICGRCQETRYCGTTCQQLDWPYHKRYCRYKARRTSLAPYSYHQRAYNINNVNNAGQASSSSSSMPNSPSRRYR